MNNIKNVTCDMSYFIIESIVIPSVVILLDKGSVARKLSVILTIEGILENKIVSVFETFKDNELLVNQLCISAIQFLMLYWIIA